MEMQKHMPLFAMILTQIIYAGLFLLTKAAISSGMKPSVFVTYQQAVATLVLTPFAFFYERKNSPPLTSYVLCKIVIVCSCGVALTLNLHYAGLKYVSATFATALTNIVPALAFIIAACSRIESLVITQRHGLAKVLGSIFCLTGAMIYTFYKGPPVYSGSKTKAPNSIAKTHTKEEWIKGSLLILFSNLTCAIRLVMQASILEQYPAKLRFTTLQVGFSCLITTVYAAIVERDISSWKLGWNINLLSVVYCGIVVTSITYTIQSWVVEKRGPVFTVIFNPLALILTAIISTLVFHDSFHWGSVVGCGMLAFGLYVFIWGKHEELQKEQDHSKEEACLESIVTSKSSPNEQKKQTLEIQPVVATTMKLPS